MRVPDPQAALLPVHAYSAGWPQHTVGIQYIRTASILQALLGNIGRPGGGILALRGHASIQGSTDIPMGENPAVGSANAKLHRLGMANLDWLVVRDFSLIESAMFWKDGPEIDTGELRTSDIRTEVFFLPAAEPDADALNGGSSTSAGPRS